MTDERIWDSNTRQLWCMARDKLNMIECCIKKFWKQNLTHRFLKKKKQKMSQMSPKWNITFIDTSKDWNQT